MGFVADAQVVREIARREWRREDKRAYARAYGKCLLLGSERRPDRPETLSLMGAQAIEMTMRRELRERGIARPGLFG